jgi:hypothetical protein
MSAELQNLINASIDSGEISESRRKIIYEKALQMSISKDECDIYIDNAIKSQRTANLALTANRKYQGAVLVVFGLIDLVYGIDCATKGRYYEDTALMCILSGLALLVFGLFILKSLNKSSLVKLFFWIIGLAIYASIQSRIAKSDEGLMKFVFWLFSLVFIFLYTVILRDKLFSSKRAEKIGSYSLVKRIDKLTKKNYNSDL